MYDIGRVCVKIAGRDAGKKCVVVENIDGKYVLVDGQTRRRKVNVAHLEPTKQVVDIKKSADHAAVTKAFEGLGITLVASTAKKTASRPKKAHKQGEKAPVTAKK